MHSNPESIHAHPQSKDVHEPINAGPHAIVQSVKIGLGKETLAVILLLVIVIGACALVMGLNLAKQADMDRSFDERNAVVREELKAVKTQEWLKERRLMDAEAVMIREGFMKPPDIEFGPTGNIHYQPEKRNGR